MLNTGGLILIGAIVIVALVSLVYVLSLAAKGSKDPGFLGFCFLLYFSAVGLIVLGVLVSLILGMQFQ